MYSEYSLTNNEWKMTYIVANWKLHGSQDFVKNYSEILGACLNTAPKEKNITTIICPPFPFLERVALAGVIHGFSAGAQDCSAYESGAHTGDVSASMIKEIGAGYVIIGHSECRQKNPNEHQYISQKILQVQKAGLTPILCVGESLDVHNTGNADSFVLDQLEKALKNYIDLKNILVAYEPIWAIGTGKTATLQDIVYMHRAIKSAPLLKNLNIPILYGGSVKPDNTSEILTLDTVQGVLVGGASLKAETFNFIVKAAF